MTDDNCQSCPKQPANRPGRRLLLLMRHGKAADHKPGGDFHRQLAPRGQQEVRRVAEYARRQRWIPELIMTSPAPRARSTAEIFADIMACPDRVVSVTDLYLAAPEELLQAVHSIPAEITAAMLVAHNPGLAMLSTAMPAEPVQHDNLPPGGLVCLEFDGNDWQGLQPGNARLIGFITPALLSKP